MSFKSAPDGLLTSGEAKHDVDLNPHIIAPDPYTSNCVNVSPNIDDLLVTEENEEDTMSAGEDDPLSGLNGRLRPRKSLVSSSQNKAIRKSGGKIAQDRPKRTSISSKASPNKQDDLAVKSDFSSTPQFLCPYCDKKFASKQTVSKHVRRMHFPASKQDAFQCLFCNHAEAESNIIRHMVDSHPNQYFACLECHTRFPSTSELAEHKLNVCEKQKVPLYRNKLRQKGTKKAKKSLSIDGKNNFRKEDKNFQDGHGFNGIVISCELKPSQVHDEADIEDNITTNLILPPSKNLGNNPVIEKSAVIVLDDIQWNKRLPPNFSFQNTDPDQILSRLGVVHRSPRTNEYSRRDWIKAFDESTLKFERCFDTNFYSKVAGNVQENLAKFLDGSFNFNPDPDNTIKTRKPKNIINAAEGFPILLACEQYSRNILDGYLPRAIAPKHKWKWDNLDNDKNLSPDQIRRNSHINNCIVTLVSNLDIWTQLCMRRKFENKFNHGPPEKKTEKQNIISKELKEILESREIPTTSQVVVKYAGKPMPHREGLDFPASLGLTPSAPKYELQPSVLSGEWVRPRCYVCCACGSQTRDPRALSVHMSNEHPNASVQHYEIVGEPLLNADILKHLYVPPTQICNRTRPLRGFRDCTKCNKSISLEDLHQHMLDCAGDTPTVRRRQSRPRPFGVRRRRPRLPDNTIRKKMRKDIRGRQRRQKSHMRPRPRPRPRSEVGDAETIRKMLADLPAKRHRVMVNPVNMLSRPRRMLEQRTKLILKKRPSEDLKNRRRIRKETKDAKQGESSTGGENSNEKNLKQELDDEDNKPLKRMISTRKLQHKSINRKNIMKRAKRRSIRVEQRKNIENIDAPATTSVDEIPTTDTPQRIDVNRGPYNTREQANRGGSNRREEQRPGCSGSNGNANNFCAPAQNVPPLKHSIARLTANSETHDKSVQFHHSFLVQQECNNTDQHLPSGQHTLFENEAVVTKLDKPPLYSTKGSLDLYALQKNKLNKPRKGLNDCIAMLKNKLVEPEPHRGALTSHISVQCGSDEPIDVGLPPLIIKQVPQINESTFQIPINSQSKSVQTNEKQYFGQKKQDKCSKSVPTQPTDVDIPNESNNPSASLIERSTTHIEIQGLHENPIKLNPDIEIIPVHSHIENVNVTERTEQKPLQDNSRAPNQTTVDTETLPVKDQSNDIYLQTEVTSLKTCTVPYTNVHWQKSLEIVATTSKTSDTIPQVIPTTSKTSDPPVEKQVDHNINNQPYNLSNDFSESLVSQMVPDAGLDCRQMPLVSYTERNIDIPAAIPPAHANSSVDSPLDLSSKIFTTCETAISEDLSIRDGSCMVCNYDDTYATLDLSNKGIDAMNEDTQELDTVVDLRVKSTPLESSIETLDLSINTDMGPDLTVRGTDTENEPTDLSIRGRGTSMSIDLSSNTVEESDIDFIQDLSTRTTLRESECNNFSCEDNISPTDLSAKSVQVLVCGNNYTNLTEATNLVIRSERSNYDAFDKKSIFQQQSETVSKLPNESNNGQENPFKSIQSRVADKSCTLVPRSAYNPNLKVPQFKSRCPTNEKAVNCVEVATIKPMSKQINSTESVSLRQDSSIFKTYSANDGSTPPLLPSASIKNAVRIGAGSVTGYLLSNRATTSSIGKLESTMPVYALANTCISVTKIEPSTSVTLTNSLLSVAGTTIASTIPVYTLAGTTVATPEVHAAVEAELKNYSMNREYVPSCESAICESETLNCETENIDKDLTEEEKAQLISDMLKSLTPEKAQKIFVLPDHIKLILARMQPDHRNQLMNVLPQFQPTTSDLSLISSNAPHTVTSATSDIITFQIQHAVSLSNIVCSASTSQQALNINMPSSNLPKAFVLPITSAPTSLTGSEGQAVDPDLRISKIVKEELFTIDTDKYLVDPASGIVAGRSNDFNRNCVIDLTKDENIPTAVEEISQVVCQDQPTLPVPKTVRQRSNDQTASLRAVRIKAPSERHKEIQLSKRASEEQNPTFAQNDTADNGVNQILESGIPSSVQQVEVSNAKHHKTSTDSKRTVTLPPVELNFDGITTLTQEHSPTTVIPVKKDHENVVYNQHSGYKSSVVNLSVNANSRRLSNGEQSQDDVHANSKYAATSKQSPKSLVSEACSSKKLKVSEENNVDDIDKRSQTNADEVQGITNTKTLFENDDDKNTLDDEDSEDDVSLAIIVKKKHDELILKSHTKKCHESKHSHKITTGKKKKKEKKSTKAHNSKKRKKSKNSKNEEVESVVSLTDLPNDEIVSDDTEGNDNITDDNKNLKKKCKITSPQLSAVDAELQGQPDIDKDKENYIVPDGTKTNVAPDVSTETLQTSDKSGSKSIEVEIVRPQSALNETSVKTANVKESTEAAKTSVVKLQKDTNEDLDDTKVSSTADLIEKSQSANDIVTQNEICENETNEQKCVATSAIEEKVIISSCELSKNEQGNEDNLPGSSTQDAQELVASSSTQFEKKSVLLNDDQNKTTCSKTIKDVQSLQMIVTNDPPANCDVEENVALPLRRSRRGKTLFVDTYVPDHDNSTTTSENPIEKAPLTKKQLIFSKLLLDEENHNKCPEAIGNQNTNDKNEEVLNTKGTTNATSDCFEPLEKSRSTKRKNPPQLKRKSKKKKSLDLGSYTRDETNVNNSDNVNQQAVDDNTVNMTTDTQLKDSVIITEMIDTGESGHVLPQEDSSKQTPEFSGKVDEITNIEVDSASLIPNVISEESCNKLDNSKINYAEKRKLSTATNVNSTPKPKRTKLNKIDSDKIEEPRKCARVSAESETGYGKEGSSYTAFAAKRTRSKSVIVKSSNSDFYDPYDIDLDDVPEKAEPFRKNFSKFKTKNISKPCTIVSTEAIETEISSECNIESSEAGLISHLVTEISDSRKDDHNHQNKNEVKMTDSRPNLDTIVHTEVEDNVNDSDDSSKSDVPLKRYVEEKGKKIDSSKKEHLIAGGASGETNENNCNDENEKNRTSVTVENSSNLARETEEQLRSEQFMESFGFFSERKPRKSNLLASKKISETFHIIANESDDVYFGFKERTSKKRLNENRKSKEGEGTESQSKTNAKRGRKKKSCTSTETCYCYICKKEFRRPDNYLRHQMTLLHISKLSEVELRVKTVPVPEEPNYLIPYKQQLDRLKILTRKLAKQKKNSKSKIKLPTLEEILENVNKTVREQQLSRTNRSLSRDEALFIDCCELLKESHKSEPAPNPETLPMTADVTFVSVAHCSRSGLELIPKTDTNDGDVDSITAKTILESEEVRNLENDLISGLKEAAEAANAAQSQLAMSYQHSLHDIPSTVVDGDENLNMSEEDVSPYDEKKNGEENFDATEEILTNKHRKYPEIKEKMYPDIEEIDMFEDKFDKIKRKCRSQAAAAKHMQPVIESSGGHKGRKKLDKKKGKNSSKKNSQNTVLTKGALKGFDGIKVSIPTSDINLSAIAPPTEAPVKKKRKSSIKKKRDKRESESSNKYDNDIKLKESSASQKKVDVYEFMDNEDAELFEFRPSTLMERFKSISSKEMPSTSKINSTVVIEEKSSESASDGDDFVYMSDDYLCSDDETENSLMSCELGNLKIEAKKNISPLKRKDVVEKNAVMGKIFKHNAVRSEKKCTKTKEVAKPKANLDQLFDSLLEDEPNSSLLYSTDSVQKVEIDDVHKTEEQYKKFELLVIPKPRERVDILDQYVEFMRSPKKVSSRSPEQAKESVSKSLQKYDIPKKADNTLSVDYGPSTSKKEDFTVSEIYGPSTSKKCDRSSKKDNKTQMPKRQDYSAKKYDDSLEFRDSLSKDNKLTKSIESKCEEMFKKCVNELNTSEVLDDAGVARQRARRKCTVGKQNVLAETWSSESEPDEFPPRPNSAESVVVGAGRKKKSRKKDGQQSGGRRGKQTTLKKQDIESRVTSSNRNTSSGDGKSYVVPGMRVAGGGGDDREFGESSSSSAVAGPSSAAESAPSPAVAGPSGWKGRQRSATYYWSSEGDEEQEHLQQHGWIVGDSHKKLVTMLAHAKGRKRHNDEKRHSLE